MSVRSSIGPTETIDGFEAAANQHLEAGFKLLADGSATGIQLMGIAVEILLKTAYFRYKGYVGSDDIGLKVQNNVAHSEAKTLGIVSSGHRGHDLVYWSDLIVASRASCGNPLASVFETELRRHIQNLITNYDIGIRYFDLSGVDFKDMDDVFEDVMWLFDNYQKLWS